jgi:hypothetical protein
VAGKSRIVVSKLVASISRTDMMDDSSAHVFVVVDKMRANGSPYFMLEIFGQQDVAQNQPVSRGLSLVDFEKIRRKSKNNLNEKWMEYNVFNCNTKDGMRYISNRDK